MTVLELTSYVHLALGIIFTTLSHPWMRVVTFHCTVINPTWHSAQMWINVLDIGNSTGNCHATPGFTLKKLYLLGARHSEPNS
jgi:hypothetical protein